MDINTIDDGVFKAMVVRELIAINPLLGLLIRIVKAWARASGIADPKNGSFNSYCLCMLAVFHLQQLPGNQLPPVWQLFRAADDSLGADSVPRPLMGGQPASEEAMQVRAFTQAQHPGNTSALQSLTCRFMMPPQVLPWAVAWHGEGSSHLVV